MPDMCLKEVARDSSGHIPSVVGARLHDCISNWLT